MSGCMLTFSPDLTLNLDLFYELVCELVFYSVDGVKVNKQNKEKALDLELSYMAGNLSEGMKVL